MRFPALPSGSSSVRSTAEWRSVGPSTVVHGWLSHPSTKSSASDTSSGRSNTLALVLTLTKASRTSHVRPTVSAPDRVRSSHARAGMCLGDCSSTA